MSRPPLTVILLTYTPAHDHPRHDYAVRTLLSVILNLRYSGELRLHIADDGSPEKARKGLEKIALNAKGFFRRVTITNTERRGYGANYNAATQAIHGEPDDLVLPLEDDWVLGHDLNIDPYADDLAIMEANVIRFGYLGYTQPVLGEVVSGISGQLYLAINPDSPERHVNAGHPRLETVRYQRLVGPWDETLAPGATEFEWCARPEARQRVLWPLNGQGPFGHIGTESTH